jgi:hypothetical protein
MNTELTVDYLRGRIVNLITSELEREQSPLHIQFQNLISEIAQDAITMDNEENDINWDETDELFGEFVPETQEESGSATTFGLRGGVRFPTVSIKGIDKLLHTGEEFITFEPTNTELGPNTVVNLPFEYELQYPSNELIKVFSTKFDWIYKLQNGTTAAVKPNNAQYIVAGDLHKCEIKILL